MKHHLSTILKLANSRRYSEKETKELHEAIAWVNELVAENEKLTADICDYVVIETLAHGSTVRELTRQRDLYKKSNDYYSGPDVGMEGQSIMKYAKFAKEIQKEVEDGN